MASFKAKIEARRLLKSLAVGATPQTAHSNDKALETARICNEREKIRHGDDILRKKYEELGRLLALQHLEQNVVSSIDGMDIHMRSKGHPSKASKRQRRSCTKSKGKANRKPAKQNDMSKSPGYVFVEIPQAYSEKLDESDRHDVQTNLNNERRRRPRSARVEPTQKSKISSRRSTRRKAKGRSNINSSQFRFGPTDHKESELDYFVPYDEYSYRGGHGDGMFYPRERSNAQFFDIPEGGEEIVFEEVNEEPVFVIQGEVEITESVRYNIETEKGNDDTKTFGNDKQIPERSKRVSFLLEESDKETEKKNSFSDVLKDDKRTSVNQNKLEDTPLHIVLEEEILSELLHSPRPGLYQKSDKSVDKKQTRSPRKKKKTKTSKTVKYNTENSKLGVKTADSDKNESSTISDVTTSPRITSTTPRISSTPRASDHKLETTENPAIKLWLKKKNKLIRQQKREERKKEKSKQLAEESELRERMEKLVQSEKLVSEWEGKKRRERKEKTAAERKVKRAVREAASRMAEKQDKDGAKLGEGEGKDTVRSSVVKVKKAGRSKKKSKVHPGGENTSENGSHDNKKTLQKKVSYEEWLKEKRATDRKIRLQKERLANDPELDGIIPSLGRQRIENATERRGKRLPEKEDLIVRSDLPESDQRFENPFKMPSDEEMCKSFGSSKPRPSSAKPLSTSSRFKTKKDEPAIVENRKVFQNLSQRYAWDEDKNTDKGYETFSSDNSNASVGIQSKTNQKSEPRDRPDEEENDEGIFLTEPLA